MRSVIVVAPVAFGLGPSSGACAIAQALCRGEPRPEVVGVADGMAYDHLCTSAAFDRVMRAPSGRLPDGFRPSVTVAVLDFKRAVAARTAGSRVVVVDALFWMWDKLPLDPATTDRYLCPEFPGVAERLRSLEPSARARCTVIPQVLGQSNPVPVPANERRGVLCHLGGGFIAVEESWSYLRALVSLVARAVRNTRPADLLAVTGARSALTALGDLPRSLGIQARQLPPKEMAEEIARTKLLITLPGRATTIEGVVLGTPTVLVPGLNYSQHRQSVAFRRWVQSMPVCTWSNLAGYADLPAGLPEGQAGLRGLDLGQRFAVDARAQAQLFDWLTVQLAALPSAPRPTEGAPWTTFDGADHVARHALSLMG